jgi:NAD(P)-dependent dehydrogenase (short-subunit alcohol dehydrogenase family)
MQAKTVNGIAVVAGAAGDETGASYVACSLETRDGCEQAVEATRSQLGPIEILVNNAALGAGEDGSVLDLEWGEGGPPE